MRNCQENPHREKRKRAASFRRHGTKSSKLLDLVSINFKILLGCSTQRAGPALENILKIGSRCNTVFNVAIFGAINVTAQRTNVIHVFLQCFSFDFLHDIS